MPVACQPTEVASLDMIVIGEEAELVWAFRRSKAVGNGRALAALEILRLLGEERDSTKLVDVRMPEELMSSACDPLMASSDA